MRVREHDHDYDVFDHGHGEGQIEADYPHIEPYNDDPPYYINHPGGSFDCTVDYDHPNGRLEEYP